MTLPSASSTPSALSASDINTENGYASNQQMSFDDAIVRSLAGAPGSGTTISMAVLRGKAGPKSVSAAAPIQNLNIYNTVIAAGWPGTPTVTYTIPAGTYIWSDDRTLAALTTGGPFPGGLTIVNNGYIMGKGGKGGFGGTYNGSGPFVAGNPGGPAISINSASVTLINNAPGWIGGGGGGGGSGYSSPNTTSFGGGGGAGGGAGGGNPATAAIGVGATTGNGNTGVGSGAPGGRGTRRFVLGEIAGGGGGYSTFVDSPGPQAGGKNNGVGTNGIRQGSPKGPPFRVAAAGGGGWGASGGTGAHQMAPQNAMSDATYSGGQAIALNGQTLTQTNNGTIWGAIA